VLRAHGLPLSVRGGGHDWAGRALSHQGLVVDLSRMRQVEVPLVIKEAQKRPTIGKAEVSALPESVVKT
jgi:FAD/FMN-containing dehydrogenase